MSNSTAWEGSGCALIIVGFAILIGVCLFFVSYSEIQREKIKSNERIEHYKATGKILKEIKE